MKKALMAMVILAAGCGADSPPCLCDAEYTGSATEPEIGPAEMYYGRPPTALVPTHNPTDAALTVSVDCLFFDPDGYYAGEGRTVTDICPRSTVEMLVEAYSADKRASRALCSLALR